MKILEFLIKIVAPLYLLAYFFYPIVYTLSCVGIALCILGVLMVSLCDKVIEYGKE